MPIPTISPLPVPPSRADATSFASRADAFLGALPTFQTEMNAAAVAINAVYFPPTFRNKIINGDFSVWQRGASQTSSGYGSDDRWRNDHSGSTKTHSRQAFALGQTAVPGEPEFFSRTVVASVAGAFNYVHKTQMIEGVRTFAGRTVRVSFYAKADANRPIAISFMQNFAAGSPLNNFGAQQFNLTTSWQRFTATVSVPSIAGKSIGTIVPNYLHFRFWFDAGSSINASETGGLGQQSGTFDIARVQLEEGAAETDFEVRPPGLELALCQRFFQALSDPPLRGAFGSATDASRLGISLSTPMRGAPTVSIVGALGLFDGENIGTLTTPGTQFNTPTAIEFNGVAATGTFVVGRPAMVYNNGSGVLWVSAEL